MTNLSDLKGQTITKFEVSSENDRVDILTIEKQYAMFHDQNCCESVYVEDIIGNIDNILNEKVIEAREETSSKHPEGAVLDYDPESFTWTFYIISTVKGTVTIRWYGTSNGYYSESVDFEEIINSELQ